MGYNAIVEQHNGQSPYTDSAEVINWRVVQLLYRLMYVAVCWRAIDDRFKTDIF